MYSNLINQISGAQIISSCVDYSRVKKQVKRVNRSGLKQIQRAAEWKLVYGK